MRFEIGKYRNHGWYVGRPFKFIGLVLLGLVTFPVGFLPEILVRFAGGPKLYLGLLGPAIMIVGWAKYVKPKLLGEDGFCYVPPFRWMQSSEDSIEDPLLIVKRSERPRLFWTIFSIDSAAWLSIVVAQVAFMRLAEYF